MDHEAGQIPEDFESVYRRAELLMEQGRKQDAAEWFQRAIAINPGIDYPYARLALAWLHHESTYAKAIEAARRAVSLNPESSFNHSVLAAALLDSSREGESKPRAEALLCAEKSVQLDAESSFAHAILALAFLHAGKSAESEKSARRSLELDPDNTLAAQALTGALMRQGKKESLKSLVDWQLQEHPDDDSAHVSAGFQALHDGKVDEANKHFREALRIDPGNEAAREGLVESFRARSIFYRLYLRFGQFMRTVAGDKTQWVLFIGYLVFRVGNQTLRKSHPVLAALLGLTWLTFALWTFYARGLGSFLMLTDPFARMAIRAREKWEGILVGGFASAGLLLLIYSVVSGSKDALYSAAILIFAGVPVACAFVVQHYIWSRVFAVIAGIAGVCAVVHTVGFLGGFGATWTDLAGVIAVLIGVISTWLGLLAGFGR